MEKNGSESAPEISGRMIRVAAGPLLFAVVLLIPFPGLPMKGRIVLATAALMACWWMTEALPIAATSLIPLAAFPLLGVLGAGEAAAHYGDQRIFLFVGGFFMARAMERHNLHRRIALAIMIALGTAPRRLILGFMLATALLSMWISNTAAAMIMVPIAMAVIASTKKTGSAFATALFLGIAYAASIGGVGTLVGTPPNIVLAGQVSTIFENAPPVSFAKWMVVGGSMAALFLPLAWFYLTFVAFKLGDAEGGSPEGGLLPPDLRKMGKMSRAEAVVLVVFAAMVLGWIFREDINLGFAVVPGWSGLLGIEPWVEDSTVAILGALVLFIFPHKGGGRILEWRQAVGIPWGIVLLLGGGFSLAAAFGSSGLSAWIGGLFGGLGGVPPILLVFIIAAVMTTLTEFTSNTAVTTLMMPILAGAAVTLGTDPRLFMIPAAMAASCAFMLPVATPPNAIVFGSGELRIKDMARAGLVLNIL
ncbi:MAG: SLC13 family permease [Pseudomonadota bacterium]